MVKQYNSPTFRIVYTWQIDVLTSSITGDSMGSFVDETKDKTTEDPGVWN